MVEVRNVNVPAYRGRVNAAKFAAMRKVLLAVLPASGPGLTQKEMMEAVRGRASAAMFPGSTHMWWAKTVQLDLEARGRVVRDKAAKPLRWRRRGR
jgi:hypothetical protein